MKRNLSLTLLVGLAALPTLAVAQCPSGNCPYQPEAQPTQAKPAMQQPHFAPPRAHYTYEDDCDNYDYYYFWDDNGAEAEAVAEQEFMQTRRVSCPTTFLDCYEGDYDDSWYEFHQGLETDYPGKRDDPWLDELAR